MQSPRWTWLTLIACAAAAEAPARRAQPLLTQRGGRPAAAEEFTEPAEDGENPGRTWAIPIGWTRSLAYYDLRATHAPGEGRTLAQLVRQPGAADLRLRPGSPRQRQHRPDEHLDQPGPRLLLPRRSVGDRRLAARTDPHARAVHHRQRAGGRLPASRFPSRRTWSATTAASTAAWHPPSTSRRRTSVSPALPSPQRQVGHDGGLRPASRLRRASRPSRTW